MKKILLLSFCFWILAFDLKAQRADALNNYKYVFIPPLQYGNGKEDIYGIRKLTIEKLTASGVPLFLKEEEISRAAFKNPCTMLQCLVNNSASSGGKNSSAIYILFLDCKNDTALICTATADILKTFDETRASFMAATKKALEIFNDYHHQMPVPDSSITVEPTTAINDSILWSPARKLTWDDFRGTAKEEDPADALTSSCNQTHFQAFGTGNRFEIESEIQCYFIKSSSWVKPGKQGDFLLNHEQRHFDIAEAGAREFRKRVKQTHFTGGNFQEAIKRITDEINEKYFKLQEQYDNETDHSRIEAKQIEWNGKTDAMLKALEDFK